MFDSREYEWGDFALFLGVRDITKIRGVQYTESMEKEALYAKGRYGHSIQRGNHAVAGQIILTQSELIALEEAAPNRNILNLNLTGVFSYGGNPEGGAGIIRNDRVLSIEFTEVPKELNQNDKFMEITLPFIALRVEKGV